MHDRRLHDQIRELFTLIGAEDLELPCQSEVDKLPSFYSKSPRQGALRILAERLKLTDIISFPPHRIETILPRQGQITEEYRANANLHAKLLVLIDMLNAQEMKAGLDSDKE